MRLFDLLEAAGYATTLYHGTGIENVRNIVLGREGLKMYAPRTTSGFGTRAVYLTPTIELAARYAHGGFSTAPLHRTPAIVEVKLFGSRRHGTRMRPDPLDREDNAWQDHYDDGGMGDEREAVREIERDVVAFVTDMGRRYGFAVPQYGFSANVGHEVGDLNGFPLHQYVHQAVAHYAGPQLYARIRNDVARYLNSGPLAPGGTYGEGHVVVTNSGTLRLEPDYWHAQHQNLYVRPIPASAVKAVWVRERDFPQAPGERKAFGQQLLPSEVVSTFEDRKDHLENIGDNAEDIMRRFEDDRDDPDYYRGELEELKQGVDDDDILGMIDQLIAGLGDEDFDYDQVCQDLGDRGREMAGYLYDEIGPGQDVQLDKDTVWVRVPAAQVNTLFAKNPPPG